jgi:hypothetical protein
MAEEKRAALTPQQRRRLLHMGPTVPVDIDVARAFDGETPTTPAAPAYQSPANLVDSEALAESEVAAFVPLDARPVLAVAEGVVPWSDLGALATRILRRVDGVTNAMSIVTGLGVAPSDGVRVLASLVCLGLVRLAPPIAVE